MTRGFLEGFFFQSWRTVSILRLSMLHFFKRLFAAKLHFFQATFQTYSTLFSLFHYLCCQMLSADRLDSVDWLPADVTIIPRIAGLLKASAL